MKIATFGSCLSRFIGNNYTYLYGGKIVSSVYHNRSDVFVGRFIDKTAAHLIRGQISRMLTGAIDGAALEDKADIILSNQYYESIGRHRLSKGIQFLDLLDSEGADLVILDNFMDIGARLLSVDGTEPGSKWFVRTQDLKEGTVSTIGPLLSPEAGAESMLKIIKYVQKKMPKAKVVFCNFPHNTYQDRPERVLRTQEYEALMASNADGSFTIIPCIDITKRFQTKDKQHFSEAMYCAYAGTIWSLLSKLA